MFNGSFLKPFSPGWAFIFIFFGFFVECVCSVWACDYLYFPLQTRVQYQDQGPSVGFSLASLKSECLDLTVTHCECVSQPFVRDCSSTLMLQWMRCNLPALEPSDNLPALFDVIIE